MFRQGLSFIYQDVRSFNFIAIDWQDRLGVLGLLLPRTRMLLLSISIPSINLSDLCRRIESGISVELIMTPHEDR